MPLAILLLNLIPTVLGNIPGISATIRQIITDVTSSAGAIIGSGVLSQPSVNTILAAWSGVLSALKNDPNLPSTSLGAISQLERAVQAALLQDSKAAQSVDWSLIHPMTTV